MAKLAVFVSGRGSLLRPILDHGISINLVLADRDCPALEVADKIGLTAVVVEREWGASFNRDKFTHAVLDALQRFQIDLVAMAGFKTVLGPLFFEWFLNRILNIHPSWLPHFKGAHAVEDTLEAGATITGCTVHFATPEVDDGPILAQRMVPVYAGDTVHSLHRRIQKVEQHIYPKVIREQLRQIDEKQKASAFR